MCKRNYLILGVLIICLGAMVTSGAEAAPVGTFIQAEGRVDLFKGGKLPAVEVKAQDTVEVGDVVRTKSQSRAQIKFVDNTVLTIAPESRVTIEEFMFDAAKGERKAVLGVLRGLVHTAVEKVYPKEEPDFIMKTHTAVLGVRGTRWYTKLLPTATDVYTEGSKLEVQNILPEIIGKQLMTDLQYCRIGQFMTPTVPLNITPQDLIPLQLQMQSGTGGGGGSQTNGGPGQFAGPQGPPQDPKGPGGQSLIQTLSSGAYVPPRIAPPPPPVPPAPSNHNDYNNNYNNGQGYPPND